MSENKYYIYFESKKYRVDPAVFAKMSGKFKSLLEEYPEKYRIEENLDPEVFIAFISSCQLKNFQIAPQKAQKLLEVSREWDCPSLEQYASDVCRKAGIPVYPRDDPIGDLIKKQDEGEDSAQDYKRAATVFITSLDDNRLIEMDAEPLYRIVAYAERLPNFDEKKYAEFVIKLHKQNPEAAVLLALRADFDNFNEQESDTLFMSPQMRSQAIGFFVAYSLSQMRHKVQDKIDETELNFKNALARFNYDMKEEHDKLRDDLHEMHERELEKLEKVCKEQSDEVDRLTRELTRTADILVEGTLSEHGIGDPALRRIQNDADERLEKLYSHIREELEKNHDAHREQMQKDVLDEEANWEEEYANPDKVENNCRSKLSELEGVSHIYQQDLQQIDTDLDDIREAIQAKISKDYVRTDKGTRDNTRMYSIFGEDEEKVTKAGAFLEDIDQRLEAQCPLKSGATK